MLAMTDRAVKFQDNSRERSTSFTNKEVDREEKLENEHNKSFTEDNKEINSSRYQ